jgi:transposase
MQCDSCRSAAIQDVAKELKLDWHTERRSWTSSTCAQLAKAGTPGPTVIRIDEIAVRKGHAYRIVVSDLVRERPMGNWILSLTHLWRQRRVFA